MELRGEKIYLRPLRMDDLDDCARWAADAEVTKHVVQRTFTFDEEKEWLQGALKNTDDEIYVIIINQSEKPIGTCAIHHKSKVLPNESDVSVGIMIGEKDEWGKGYGSEAIRLLAEHAHNNHSQKRVWLTVDTDHAPAIKAYEKAGFSICKTIDNSERKTTGKEYVMEKIFT